MRGIRITRPKERAFHCIISLDTYTGEKNSNEEAVGLSYAKALLSGCDGYSRETFLDAVNLLGATISVSVDRGIITISLTSTDTNMMKLLTLAEAMLVSPTFAQSEVKRIANLLGNELQEEKEDAKTQSLYMLINNIYGERDRRHVSQTDEISKKVARVTKKDLQAFHKKATQSAWIFTLTCATEHEEKVLKRLFKLRSQFKERAETKTAQHVQKLSKAKIDLLSIPSKQNIEINIGGLLPLYANQKEYYAFLFGLSVLGKWGGFAGRLMSTVREKEGLTYGIYARVETAGVSEYGYWRIMTFFAPDKVLQGITSTRREIDTIRNGGITKSEYDRFKTIIKTSETLLRDSLLRTAADMHAGQVKGFRYADIESQRRNMLNVTVSEVNAALKKYLDPDRTVITAAGPTAAKAKELKAL